MILDEVLLDEDLLSVLSHTHTRQNCDTNARFSHVFFSNDSLNTVLYLRETCDQVDVTLENHTLSSTVLSLSPTKIIPLIDLEISNIIFRSIKVSVNLGIRHRLQFLQDTNIN